MFQQEFERLYSNIRAKELRKYSDVEVMRLPEVDWNHPHLREWNIRKASFNQFNQHLLKKNRSLRILDLGCGNGWMSNKLTGINDSHVIGLDINCLEIEQAMRVFKDNSKVRFICGDIFEKDFFPGTAFDIIVLNASIQYFPDLRSLIKKLTGLIADGGELHLRDSHFYRSNKLERAREASEHYYKQLGYPEMTKQYFHHAWSELSGLNYHVRNRYLIGKSVFKISRSNKNYFPWIIITK